MLQKTIGKQVRSGHADIFDVQAKVGWIRIGKVCFCVACKNSAVPTRRDKGDRAITRAKIFISLPGLITSLEAAKKSMTLNVDFLSRK